jgi:D-beta-D-heptose 7-phosphate kinase/D-beta-D-heptose 1-phosphate adenosyltransferase
MTFSIPNFAKAKILVVGDLMLDRYWHGATDRISPEAPVPIVHIQQRHERPGGAGNVALNLRALGAEVSLLGMIGDDSAGKILEEGLNAAGIHCALERISGLPTISKLRVLGRHQQLIRLDSEQGFHQVDPTELLSNCHAHLAGVNAVILSDYGKGTLQHVQSIIQLANQRQIPVLVDPKGRDFSRYYGATIITPNLKEFEAVVGPSSTENAIAQNALALIKEYHFGAMLITRGEHGMSLIQPDQEPLHVPARVQEVYDVTGAGDTVIATLAAALAAGASQADAVLLANTAAGIAVTKMGSATVTVPELRRVLQRQHNTELGILTEDELIITVADAAIIKKRLS